MVDMEVIESKLAFLREYIGDLKEYESISLNAYRQSKKDQRFVERTLHLACESCLDIASHIISRRGLREPKDNKDLFLVLYENIGSTLKSLGKNFHRKLLVWRLRKERF